MNRKITVNNYNVTKISKLKRNIIYQTIYQLLGVITPLITAPYVSRVLGAEGLGIYTYTLTNAMYFALFAMLGVSNYGCRSIADVQNSKEKRSIVFWNIYTIQVVSSLFMILAYIVYFLLFVNENELVAFLQIITIFACMFDVNWYFFGVEKFRLTVTRNIIIKIVTVCLILMVVNKDTGVLSYSLIMAIGTLVSNLVLIPFLTNEIVYIRPVLKNIIIHIKPLFILFIPVLATSVFHVMDKTMLGSIGGLTELGYYTNADKVINIPMGIINGLGTVFLPRISAMKKESKEDKIKELITESLGLYSILIMALAFGLASIAIEFTPLFFGEGYDPCIRLIILFSPVFIIKSYSVFVRMNILVPYEKDKQYTRAVIVGAVANLLGNAILIPKFGATGAVIGTLIAEVSVCLMQLIYIPVRIGIIKVVQSIVPFFLFAIVMSVFVRLVSTTLKVGVVGVLLEILVGGLIYSLLCILYGLFYKKARLSFQI